MIIKVVNKERFDQHVIDVDVELISINGAFRGDVSIETETGWRTWTGQHGGFDFVQDFGFAIVKEQSNETD